MAPDRGSEDDEDSSQSRPLIEESGRHTSMEEELQQEEHNGSARQSNVLQQRKATQKYINAHASEPQNFTLRSIIVGLLVGVVILFSNMYFGLQTGWISGMSMPAALIGFAWFKLVARYIAYPFTPVENVLVQTVAGSVGTMPLGCGFVGVIPALNFLLKKEENGPLELSMGKLMLWAVGVCFFGVAFAVPLRREVIIRERLKFPSGTATALVIGVLHGEKEENPNLKKDIDADARDDGQERQGLMDEQEREALNETTVMGEHGEDGSKRDVRSDWKARIRTLVIAFAISGFYTLFTYFIPQLRDVPVFGLPLARNWLWTLNPSPAYVGQGIIMGPATTMHMLLGAIVGWGVLSSVAKRKGWAPGPVDDWTTGSKGWIVWVSLAIMLADSFVNLGWLVLRPTIGYAKSHGPAIFGRLRAGNWREAFSSRTDKGYQALSMDNDEQHRAPLRRYRSPAGLPLKATVSSTSQMPEPDAPPEHLVSNKTFLWTFGFSLALCVVATQLTFPIPIHLTILALVLALLLSIMGVRALGETDLNPVSGISKLTQLLFAFAVPKSNPNAVVINLVAGAISEAGALQAGDLMQDLKAGHLLGASPKAQFWGQVIGSAVGAVLSAAVYKLYTSVYKIPGGMFQVPTGYVWVFTARLVTGQGLPDKVWEFALGGGLIFAVSTCARIWLGSQGRSQGWIPGGIAVAVGMYNVPSFTLARAVGGLVSWAWQTGRITRWQRRWNGEEMREGESDELKAETDETPVIVLASGLILGEGLVSIVNLLLASAEVPHL